MGRDGITKETKHKLEFSAIQKLKSLLPANESQTFDDLWTEYETQNSAEAQMVKDFDRYDMILQAYEYEVTEKKPGYLQEFFDSTKDKFKTNAVKNLVQVLYAKREEFMKSDLPENSNPTVSLS